MLEFLAFLSSNDKEILDLIYKAQFSVEENTPLCLLGKRFFGFLKKEQRTVVICTKNAMDVSGYSIPRAGNDDGYDPTKIYISRALRHEAVHVAQSCNNGKLLNILKPGKVKIHPFKKDALKGSTSVSGNREKEYEAYLLEDRPKLVKYALEKFCTNKIS